LCERGTLGTGSKAEECSCISVHMDPCTSVHALMAWENAVSVGWLWGMGRLGQQRLKQEKLVGLQEAVGGASKQRGAGHAR
jgi:hypothetical protein